MNFVNLGLTTNFNEFYNNTNNNNYYYYYYIITTVSSRYSKPLNCGHFAIKATFYWHGMNCQCFM